MRSELVALNNRCSLSASCNLCGNLGYLASKKESKPYEKVKSVLEKGITKHVVLPCTSVELKEFDQISESLKDSASHVIFYRKWLVLQPKQKEKLLGLNLALVFDHIDQIENAEIPSQAELYFALTPSGWDLKRWLNLQSPLKDQMHFFFPANPQGLSTLFSAEEIYEITEFLLNQAPKVLFKSPFGHDLLDNRNSDHLNWILEESESFETKLSSSSPNISIIIPSYNRSEFIRKILHCLGKQTLRPDQFEVIIVDDGSTDSTKQIVQKFNQWNSQIQIRYFYVPRRLPVRALYNCNRAGPIRNLGASKARGEIFLFMDSDILIPQNYLQELCKQHQSYDVVVPRRVYLNKETTSQSEIDPSAMQPNNRMQINWQDYLKDFYSTDNWESLELPWKYFMTYCLSVRREIFFQAGGFRTNFISYGYEDLDWGYRVVQSGARLKYLPTEVYHLYHFDGGSEYTLSEDFRHFQLAMSSRVFVAQNMPVEAKYLIGMTRLKNDKQRKYFRIYRILWKSFHQIRKAQWKLQF